MKRSLITVVLLTLACGVQEVEDEQQPVRGTEVPADADLSIEKLALGCKRVCPQCIRAPCPCQLECPPAECRLDSDCRLSANYCGGCACDALTQSEAAAVCRDPVQCLRNPCGDYRPACVSGQCTKVHR
jgi:hypothetical protein